MLYKLKMFSKSYTIDFTNKIKLLMKFHSHIRNPHLATGLIKAIGGGLTIILDVIPNGVIKKALNF